MMIIDYINSQRSWRIKFPMIAYKTYQQLKTHPKYMAIVETTSKKLQQLLSPLSRIKFIHEQVDYFVNKTLEEPLVKQNLQCRMGCSACCYSQVSVTQEETQLLAMKVLSGVDIDVERLNKQRKVSDDLDTWLSLDYEDRKCVFLSANGLCRVYEDRPSVCRTNNVISHPLLCETKDARLKPIRLIKMPEADMVIYSSFKESPATGSLPRLLWHVLDKMDTTYLKTKKTAHQVDL